MLKKLSPPQYPLVLPLYTPLDFNLVIRSVEEGNTPAWVYVDRPASPGAALLEGLNARPARRFRYIFPPEKSPEPPLPPPGFRLDRTDPANRSACG